ncbi:hypothetical protein [Nocardia sp. AG03]|uniref:hypothetical protein n=1 Tax=Nocardia sp. AG03 TaxID=3025312 RepID=UPI0024185D52|nr:hypothetical protein [Nocardia sp. AG03]
MSSLRNLVEEAGEVVDLVERLDVVALRGLAVTGVVQLLGGVYRQYGEVFGRVLASGGACLLNCAGCEQAIATLL